MLNIMVLFLHKAISWSNYIFPSNLIFPVIENNIFCEEKSYLLKIVLLFENSDMP